MKNLTLLYVLVLCFTSDSFGQGNLKGQLLDSISGEPLINATITIENSSNLNLGSFSDFEGGFNINNIDVAKGSILINYLGYNPKSVPFDFNGEKSIDLGTINIAPSSIGLEEIKVVSNIAIDRKTPVAVSTISGEEIDLKIGNQEFVEMVRHTPSVYTTKEGGGYGDSRINIRGFNQRNIAVMVNGIPVNDMENGWVYWSNWSGLSDVTRFVQIQRGLGASKLAISSVGGTKNIITRTTDQKKSAIASIMYGNNNFMKARLTLSSGKLKGDWSFAASGSYTRGEGYVPGTWIDAWSYFASITKAFGDNHQLVLTAVGAPQSHGQRSFNEQVYLYDSLGQYYNGDMGFSNGQVFSTRSNFYHKPQIALNHYWRVSDKARMQTSAYYSMGRGGGMSSFGGITDGQGGVTYRLYNFTGDFPDQQAPFNRRLIRVDDVIAWNSGEQDIWVYDAFIGDTVNIGKRLLDPSRGRVAGNGSGIIMRSSVNQHDWFGVLSNLNIDLTPNLNAVFGVDIRHYIGTHFGRVEDLMGNDYYFDDTNMNAQSDSFDVNGDGQFEKGAFVNQGDKIYYHNVSVIGWQGAFAQLEYDFKNGLNAFVTGTFSRNTFRRIDYFQYGAENQSTERLDFYAYTVKGGANYNINKNHNIFTNIGYFTIPPRFNAVFPTFSNEQNLNAVNEKVFSVELGYGLRYKKIKANLNLYRTEWRDKSFTTTLPDPLIQGEYIRANVLGVNAIHQGIELDVSATPVKGLTLRGMCSLGDWRWANNVEAITSNEYNIVSSDTIRLYIEGIKVGDVPQSTFGAGAKYTFPFGLRIDADYWYCIALFSDYDPADRTIPTETPRPALQLPSYGLLDVGISYAFKYKSSKFILRFNMNNVLDTRYLAEIQDVTPAVGESVESQISRSRGWYGFGRTWNVSLKYVFSEK